MNLISRMREKAYSVRHFAFQNGINFLTRAQARGEWRPFKFTLLAKRLYATVCRTGETLHETVAWSINA
jgi:hypothetical protein